MGNWIKKTFRKYSYVFNLVLVVAALAFAGVTIYQCVQIKNYYSVRQAELTQIKESLVSLEEYVDEHPPTEENPAGVQIEIAYPSTVDDLDEISDVLSIVQEDNAQALSTINSYLVIFSITITVVTILIPILNYAFIQKDQIKRLDKQYKKTNKELASVKDSYDKGIERMQNSITQMKIVLDNTTNIKPQDDQENVVTKVKPISESPQDKANAYLLNSRMEYLNKNYTEALKEVNKAIEFKPDEAGSYYVRSVTLLAMKRFTEALNDANKAIEIKPDDADFYHNRSYILFMQKEYEKALKTVERAIEFKSDNAAYLRLKATILLAMKKYEAALKEIEKVKRTELIAGDYIISAAALVMTQNVDKAIKELEAAIELEPEDPKPYHLLALYYDKIDKKGKAAEYANLADEKGYVPKPKDIPEPDDDSKPDDEE